MKHAILVLLFSSSLIVAGQGQPKETTKQLFDQLSKSHADTNRISLFLKLGNYYLFKPGQAKNDLDSAMRFYTQAESLSGRLRSPVWQNKTQACIGEYYFEAENLEEGIRLIKKVIAYFQTTGDKKSEADTWYRLGDLLFDGGKNAHPDDRLSYYDQASALYSKIGDKARAAWAQERKGGVYYLEKKYSLAEQTYLAYIDQYRKFKYKKGYYLRALSELYMVSVAEGNYYKQLYYQQEQLNVLLQHTPVDSLWAETCYYSISLVYNRIEDYAKGQIYAERALELSSKHDADNYYNIETIVVYSLMKQHKFAEVFSSLQKCISHVPPGNSYQRLLYEELIGWYYSQTGNYKVAEYHLQKSLLELTKLETYKATDGVKLAIWMRLVFFYNKYQQFKKADYYLRKIYTVPPQHFDPAANSMVYQQQSIIDSAAGNYLSALSNFKMHKRIDDSIVNVTRNAQINQLSSSFENKQRQQRIDLLDAQNKVQQTKLHQANLQRNFTFAGIALALVVAGGAAIGFNNKLKSNRLLKLQQTKISIQNDSLQKLLLEKENLLNDKDELLGEKDLLLKEVHHRVKNNLQIVMSLLNTQSAYLGNKAAIDAITESQNRVQAIAILHQKLYRGSGGVFVSMQTYVNDIISNLDDSFNASARRIRFEKILSFVELDISRAVPVGLILNEAITNAIKYAFDADGGIIRVGLEDMGNGKLSVTIADNGKGLPSNFKLAKTNSLGMELMKVLSKQLNGEFSINSSKSGTILKVDFFAEEVGHFQHNSNLSAEFN